MNILVLSDLHIGSNDGFGTFQWNELEFIMLVEKMRDRYSVDKIIMNGDIFELLKYTFKEVRNAYPGLMKYFSHKDFIFIKGNHDIVNSFGCEYFQITNSSGQRIHIEHGHNADWFNGSKFGRALGKLGFSILRKMTRSKWMLDIYFKINAFEDTINRIPKRYNRLKYLSYAVKLLKDHDVVVLAHTHKLESHHTYYLNKKKRYLNCGSCSLGRFQGVVLDTETLKYEFIKETSGAYTEKYQAEYAL